MVHVHIRLDAYTAGGVYHEKISEFTEQVHTPEQSS
jgi:hypothetical protein